MWIMRILDVIYPPVCLTCGKEILRSCETFPLCEACNDEIDSLRMTAPRETPEGLPEVVDLYCAYRYTGKLREAILRYKFQGEIWMAEPFAELFYRQILKRSEMEKIEIMTYVPISEKRFAERGYDQTLEIVKKLQKKSGIPYIKSFTKKNTAGDNAAEQKNRKERNRENRYLYTGKEIEIRNKSVLLIDDILTTGSTLRECTRLLLENGAGCVFAAVLASGRRDI